MDENLSQLPEAWKLAIRREQDSHSYYKRMAQSTTDASLKALFEDLAAEEAKHRQRLETAYRRLFEADLEEPKGRAGVFEHTLQAELHHPLGGAKAPPLISWQEWGEEAFRLARTLDVPILLSISAVWCHWCHVMDQTTFADPEVVSLIAAHFVPVRVDNDKRPDINARYNMGGWPTVAFLTPEGEILSGGTYMPPAAFTEALQHMSDYYRDNKEEVQSRSADMQAQRKRVQELTLQRVGELTPSIAEQAFALAVAAYDPQYGGFGDAPKFPQVDVIELALARHARVPPPEGQVPALDIAVRTLRAMAQGAMYDHEAGGFFRYSTTRDWSVPHFEKMLEDNSRLLSAYLHAYQLTDEPLFRQTAEGVISYVESTLRDREYGYFYGSQDADEEYYALKKAEREQRQAPFVDTVCYTSWNAMMSLAYLEGAVILERPELAASALTTLGFLWGHCWQPGEGLSHFWAAPAESGQDSGAHLPGLLHDQVWVAKALLYAYEYTSDPEHLERAQHVLQWVHSALATKAGNFQDRRSAEAALGRLAEAEVSMTDNAVAAEALIHLARLTDISPRHQLGGGGDDQYLAWARMALSTFVTDYQRYGTFAAGYALAVEQLLSEPLRVVVVGSAEDAKTLELLHAAWRPYALNRALVAVDPLWEVERLQALGYPPLPAPRAYVCLGHTCAEPAAEAAQVVAAIKKLSHITS